MYSKKLVEELIEKYERAYAPGKERKRSISIKFTGEKFSNYTNTGLDDYERYNASCKKLESKNIIQIHWKYKIEGHIVDKIVLDLNNIDEAYKYINKRNIKDSKVDTLSVLDNYVGQHEIVDKFIDYIRQRVIQNKSVKQYLKIEDVNDINTLIKGCVGVLSNKSECYIRELSARIYKDTKVLESYERRISKVIKDFGQESDYVESYEESIFELYNILRNPRQVRIKGDLKIVKSDSVIDLGVFEDGLGIGSNDLSSIEFIKSNNVDKIITIENLTTYNTYNSKNAVIIYTGGFNSSVTINLLKNIYSVFDEAEYLHWGDIDCGGFKILNHQKQASGIKFKPMYMDIDTYNKYKYTGKELTSSDIDTLSKLVVKEEYSEFEELIKQMLTDLKKIEQESIALNIN